MTDIDSILLVSYQPDNNFDEVIDTQRMYADNSGYGLSHDTCYLDVVAPFGKDYKIIFPTVGVSYNISHNQATVAANAPIKPMPQAIQFLQLSDKADKSIRDQRSR